MRRKRSIIRWIGCLSRCCLVCFVCLGVLGCGLASKDSELRSEQVPTEQKGKTQKGKAEKGKAEKKRHTTGKQEKKDTKGESKTRGETGEQDESDGAETQNEEHPEDAFTGTPIPYTTRIEIKGAEKELLPLMERASSLIVLAKKAPDSVLGIERRAMVDAETAVKLMQSQCYYEGEASYVLDENAKPVSVVLTLKPGPRYTVGHAKVVYEPKPVIPETFTKRVRTYGLFGLDKEELPGPEFPREIPGVEIGKPIIAEVMLDKVQAIADKLHGKGYPLAKVVDSVYTLKRETRELNADIVINPGPAAHFGDVRVHGNSGVTSQHIQNLVRWREGKDPWDEEILEDYANDLRHSGLFRSVVTKPAADAMTVGKDGIATLPVDVTVKEAPFRTVGASAHYDTSTGFGVQGTWEHRNLFHNGEKLSVVATAATLEQGVKFAFEKPAFYAREQKLLANLSATHEYTDAYERTGVNFGTGVERRLTRTLWGGLGVFAEGGVLEDTENSQQSYSAYGPSMSLRHDSRDNTLNPTRGSTITWGVKPFAGHYTENFTALAQTLSGSFFYAPFRKDNDGGKSDKIVLAAKLEGGSLVGPELHVLPSSMRYYTGGAGSVRGYAYQAIGPRDKEDDPKGGRSYQLVNLEARYKLNDSVGIVPFVDGGMVYTDEVPEIIGDMRWGAGLGLRYFTPIGPLRFDVATPLNPIEGDPPVQIYISIGQSF